MHMITHNSAAWIPILIKLLTTLTKSIGKVQAGEDHAHFQIDTGIGHLARSLLQNHLPYQKQYCNVRKSIQLNTQSRAREGI